MTPKILNFSIEEKEISINDRFTLILGKFKKETLNQVQRNNIFDILEDLDLISIENFIKLFNNKSKEYSNLDDSLNVLNFLREYRKIANNNSEIIIQYSNLIQSLVSVLEYNLLLNQEDQLLKEFELSKIRAKSSDIAAKTDLLKKLTNIISKNKKKLNYCEEDYFNFKNQIDQISNTVQDYKIQIKNLNIKKKDCFNQINRITRDMTNSSEKNKNDSLDLIIDNKNNLSKSEKIKALQKQASDFQYQIKQINSKQNNSQLKYNDIAPNYETLKEDYNSLLETIKKDENRLKGVQKELEDTLKVNMDDTIGDLELYNLNLIKPTQEIENEIQKTKSKINNILEFDSNLNKEDPKNLTNIYNKLKKIDKNLIDLKDELNIPLRNNEITQSIESFRKSEFLINNLESTINNFLKEINLKINFNIVIDERYSSFFIKTVFIRSNKESLNFKELTTPEKIFFVISTIISINVLLNSKHIFFSNLFIPNEYNKRGSVFRTINKIVQIFEKDNRLKKFFLIFIISNLEMKKTIENLKIVKIEEVK